MKKNIIVIIAIAAMCIVGMFIFKNEISIFMTARDTKIAITAKIIDVTTKNTPLQTLFFKPLIIPHIIPRRINKRINNV